MRRTRRIDWRWFINVLALLENLSLSILWGCVKNLVVLGGACHKVEEPFLRPPPPGCCGWVDIFGLESPDKRIIENENSSNNVA